MSGQGASNNESRTNAVGKKRHAESTSSTPKKKRNKPPRGGRRRGAKNLQSLTSSNSSVLADQSISTSTDNLALVPTPAPAPESNTANLGKNRLAAGFTRPTLPHDPQTSAASLSTGESAGSAIEISDDDEDDEMEESDEGGMVLNLQEQQTKNPIVLSDDDIESGEYSSPASVADSVQPQETATTETMNTSVSAQPVRTLADLNSHDLEDQMTYAFYYLQRDQVDLNRPVVCLQCLSEGHISTECAEKSPSYIRLPKVKAGDQIKLWISCCICASRQHLVGDCPDVEVHGLRRWSLKTLNPDQIVNMSLESGTRKLETEAENRGMRPAGLQIRGRAGRHNAGQIPEHESDSDEGDFFANKRAQQNRGPRYDRFDPPAGPRKGGPGPSNYYATDSFGRRRSRSPESEQSYRGGRRSSPPRREADRWQPSQHQQEPANSRYRDAGLPPRPNVQISLPERRGSNPYVNQKQNSGPSTNNKSFHPTRPKKKNKQKN